MSVQFRNICKKAIIASLAVILACTGITPVNAEGPDGGIPSLTKSGCLENAGWDFMGARALRRGGKNFKNVGTVRIYAKKVGANKDQLRICAYTKHGSKTWGKPRYTAVFVGQEDKYGGNRDYKYYDEGTRERQSEGRAITPGNDKCMVVKAKIKHKGETYKVVVGQNVLSPSSICN